MSDEGERRLYKDLAYLAENFDFNDPEDAWAKREYIHIKNLLGIPEKLKKIREENQRSQFKEDPEE